MAALQWSLVIIAVFLQFIDVRPEDIDKGKFDVIADDSKFPYKDIRLPGNIVPVEYRIFLHPNITDGEFGVTGDAKIVLDVKKDTDAIILHSASLSHIYTSVHEYNLQGNKLPIKAIFRHQKHELVMIQLEEKLSTTKKYLLHIMFAGKLVPALSGFYLSSYKTKNGDKKYLATTHFEAMGARLAFPCFDEPAMKAKFTIIMVRENIHTALSNMPVEKTIVRTDGLMEDHFQQSVRMSTYLVAFVVSDFAHKSSTSKRGVKIRVWAPPHLISQAEYAAEVTPKILDHYEKFFKVQFPLPKQDLIAIPDFAAGAMENWGLITYRVTALMFDKKESSESTKEWVATVIAHELAHQWFGNLVTMKWWNDLWLNEGFASFVEYIGADAVAPSWHMKDQFNTMNLHGALAFDSKRNSHPISVKVTDPADINAIFDAISYSKGSSIIRMMSNFIGEERFKNGLAYYLQKYKYRNAASDDLWACLTKATDNTINVKAIMDTWTLQMGYPVIHVSRDPTDKQKAIITQERFVIGEKEKGVETKPSPFKYKWEVPVSFYFQRNKMKQETWLHVKDESLTVDWPQKAGWLKVNVDQIGFYRVNYDDENWKALTSQLNEDHMKLSTPDRSHLINDAFALAEAGRLRYAQALDLTEYLRREKQYSPFYTGMASLAHIGRILLHRAGYVYYKKYIRQTVSPLVTELGWEDKGSHLTKYMRKLVMKKAVYYNKTDAVGNAMGMYNDWMVANKRLPANLRSVVFLAGIKYGGEREWNYMFERYKSSMQPSEKQELMYALTETSNPVILKRFLSNALNNDIIRSQDSDSVIYRIAANDIGKKMALEFVKSNWEEIYKRYHLGGMGTIIRGIFARGKTEEELAEATDFINTHELGSGTISGTRALASIRNNIDWLKKNENSVATWLKAKV